MVGVFRAKEGALMMVKPPRDTRRWRVLKINDGVFIAVEVGLVEQRAGPVYQAGELKFGVFIDDFPVKAGKQGRRGGPVKTLVVVKDPNLHSALSPRVGGKCKSITNDIPR